MHKEAFNGIHFIIQYFRQLLHVFLYVCRTFKTGSNMLIKDKKLSIRIYLQYTYSDRIFKVNWFAQISSTT